jgi:hypothetical protein
MDFKKEILKDPGVNNAKRLAKYIIDHPKESKELVKLIFDQETNISMRSAWILSHVCVKEPDIVKPYLNQFLKYFRGKTPHPGTIRCILNCIEEIDIPEKYCGEIFDFCIGYAKSALMPHAVRAFSITILGNVCEKYPELKPEVDLILNELKTFPQPASIAVRIRDAQKILSKL